MFVVSSAILRVICRARFVRAVLIFRSICLPLRISLHFVAVDCLKLCYVFGKGGGRFLFFLFYSVVWIAPVFIRLCVCVSLPAGVRLYVL